LVVRAGAHFAVGWQAEVFRSDMRKREQLSPRDV
jgi:hypothetical protein